MSFSHKGMEKNVQVHLMSFHYIHAERRTNGQPDRRTDGHTSTPLLINVIVPSYLRHVDLMLYSWTANIYSSELDAAPRSNQWLHVPTQGGGGTKPHQPLGAAGTVTIYQHSINCQHLQKQMLLCLPKRNIQKDRFYSEIVIKESHGLVGSSY